MTKKEFEEIIKTASPDSRFIIIIPSGPFYNGTFHKSYFDGSKQEKEIKNRITVHFNHQPKLGEGKEIIIQLSYIDVIRRSF